MAKRTLWAASFALTLLLLLPLACLGASRSSFVFFEGTQYPLHVVFIQGEKPGPTVMIQGGIQGDEPTGFLAAQILAESRVRTGNLIVVPRANVPSIHVHQRAVNVDMNRRFDRDYNQFYEDRLARAVRFLLSQSSALIHLHEGSGFYDPEYVNPLRNPSRWGQSIIIDANVHDSLDLARLVNSALREINASVREKDYEFKLFNTRTFESDSRYAQEMRKSLTFYALANLNIPAMAVEVSKNIGALGWKVKHQVYATGVLLRHCGVDIVPPSVDERDVQSQFERDCRPKINGTPLDGRPLAIRSGGTITVDPASIGQNADKGQAVAVFASDRQGVNIVDSPRMALERFKELETRVDGRKVSSTTVRFAGAMPPPLPAGPPVFVCWLNGKPVQVRQGETLHALVGDQLVIEGVLGSKWREVLNFKGYTARPTDNDGQDMGWEIILDPESFIDRYRLPGPQADVARYQVLRETKGARPSSFYVDVAPRIVRSVKLVDAKGQVITLRWSSGGEVALPAGQYTVAETASNGPANRILSLAGGRPLRQGDTFRVEPGKPLLFSLRQATTFAALGTMTLVPKAQEDRAARNDTQLVSDGQSARYCGELPPPGSVY
ncbi:Carboxypeptidase controlling helical cell shape [Humidesulfovibrio mexicanus]|uniref:Carboxypeptidase controlling helical cell shape n=1 Tax=Humidesulfovibrio mexicanus TaxID=147047 RepID=A0A239AUQ8_9BACT|nr:M99 family carboxypeptidase catalytic domain-containing protein [Humidesulfovibrio mexicanus]SNR98774.1 Carboxypeptidase controlling helical cell shape [Humidesulfovibrio mexicanus]